MLNPEMHGFGAIKLIIAIDRQKVRVITKDHLKHLLGDQRMKLPFLNLALVVDMGL